MPHLGSILSNCFFGMRDIRQPSDFTRQRKTASSASKFCLFHSYGKIVEHFTSISLPSASPRYAQKPSCGAKNPKE
jgi:hypothetical protein